jgi:hypothetical protein
MPKDRLLKLKHNVRVTRIAVGVMALIGFVGVLKVGVSFGWKRAVCHSPREAARTAEIATADPAWYFVTALVSEMKELLVVQLSRVRLIRWMERRPRSCSRVF